MPIFPNKKTAFIHIPKTGGTSISHTLLDAGYMREPIPVKEHSQQHSTLQELIDLGLVGDDYEIITCIRHPYQRFVSEYHYRCRSENYKGTVYEFCSDFFNGDNEKWDNHNLSMTNFLTVGNGIYNRVRFMLFNTLAQDLKAITGLTLSHHYMKSEALPPLQLHEYAKQGICDNWGDDFINFKVFKP